MIDLKVINNEIDSCSICLDDIEKNIKGDRNYLFILECNHSYHYDCFLNYIDYNLQKIKEFNCVECPLCRTKTKIHEIMYSIVDKFYNMKLKINKLEKRRTQYKKKLLYLNFGKYLCFRQNSSTLQIQEENLMGEIEKYNCLIYNVRRNNSNLVKIYNNLINRVETEIY